jgi:hypothetical protein
LGSLRSIDRRGLAAGLFFLFLRTLTIPATARAQYVRVRITDDASDAPVPNALVTALADRSQWRADTAGIVVFMLHRTGTNVFTVRRFGFAPITTTLEVPEHDTLKIHVIMHAVSVQLDAVNVSAASPAASAFGVSMFDVRRATSAGGHFITREDIERRNPFETLDLFKNVLGVEVQRNSRFQTRITSTRGTAFLNQCVLKVGVDGAIFGLASDDGFDVNAVPPSDIYGIEIYNGAATIPAQYLSATAGSYCGLIMIWTRGGAGQREAPKKP